MGSQSLRVTIPTGKYGLTYSYIPVGVKIGVILAIETDTAAAATHPEVLKFAENVAQQISAMNPVSIADLLGQQSLILPGQTITQLNEATSKASNSSVVVTQFVRFGLGENLGNPSDFAAEVARMALLS